jgi:High potential iron-sulfur protein
VSAMPAADATTAALPMVKESDTQAVALGYVENAIKADTAKFKNYVPGSQCSNCALYQGKVDAAAGPCPLFAGKNVASKGWCTSWAKKA